jgi:hypothetical protein
MPSPEDMKRLLAWLTEAGDPGTEDNFRELCRAVTVRKNRENALRYARVPFARRVALVPQCLRRIGVCRAKEAARTWECARCMQCPAGEVSRRAEELGYAGTYVLKGGRAVEQVLTDAKPQAVLGVACPYEGALGIIECERAGVPVQFVPLTRDGCSETDVDMDEVVSALEFAEPAHASPRSRGAATGATTGGE